MGYEIHIYRKTNWDIDVASDITLDEWLNYIKSDPELELDTYDKQNPESTPGFCFWNNSPDADYDNRPWLSYSSHGHISTKWTDQATIIKMVEIASKLNAKVMGDEGEFYNEFGEVIIDRPATKEEKKPWWKVW